MSTSPKKLVVRKSPFSERGGEVAITLILLVLAFVVASLRNSVPQFLAIGGSLALIAICAIYNILLQIRNYRRDIPIVIDTAGRWTCTKDTLDQIESHLDYYCKIPRSEHRKGPKPKVTVADRDKESSRLDYIQCNENGDLTIHFTPRRLPEIGTKPPVKLSIVGS